jgi:DNA-binding MarR family transcriptional regulator
MSIKDLKSFKGDPEYDIIRLWRVLDLTRFLIARLREQELARFGITPEQAYVLDILSDGEGSSTINEIVKITARRHHSISTLVRRMIDQGLVSRSTNTIDRRKLDIHITEKGRRLYSTITKDSIIDVFSSLDKPRRKQLEEGLLELMKSADIVTRNVCKPDI